MLRAKQRRRQHTKMNERVPHHHHGEGACKAANGAARGAPRRPLHLYWLDKVHRIPVLEAAIGAVNSAYGRVKESNSYANWGLEVAESKLNAVAKFALTSPTLQTPLYVADVFLCTGIGFVESKIPAIKQQPQELLETVRGVVSSKADAVARPVLVRAASVKEVALRRMSSARDLGLQRADEALNTRVGAIAAESLDVTLELAEQLLDTYLPPEAFDESLDPKGGEEQEPAKGQRALVAVHRVDRLTRTLQRRLTRRTVAQVVSLREHAMHAVTTILGIAKTVVNDPRGSADFVAQLWRELSQDEPENQPPPETLEQRTTLLAREAARRVVHVVNAVAAMPVAASTRFSNLLIEVLHSVHLDGVTHAVVIHSRHRFEQLQALVKQFNAMAAQLVEAARRSAPRQPVSNNHSHIDQLNNHIHNN